LIRVAAYKFAYTLLVIWGVASLVFCLFSILPGDPSRMMLGQRDDEQLRLNIQKKYGFDRPLEEQYLLYLNDLSPVSIHSLSPNDFTYIGNHQYKTIASITFSDFKLAVKYPYLRTSFVRKGTSVGEIISDALPNTFILAFSAIGIAMFFGIFLGLLCALYHQKFIDHFLSSISVLGMALPSFFSAIIMAWLFGFVWQKYTGLSMTGSLFEVDDYGTGEYIAWRNLILPAITLGIRPLAVVMQLTRNSLLDTMNEDYIRTAKAKGLSSLRILFTHALPNALNPVVTSLSGWFASMLAGAVFVEYIFGWNGLGKEIVNALNYLDLPLVMGAVLCLSLCFVFITILTDVIYYFLDPRLRA
jgi:peptide/nickel transport system permease protein